MTRKKNKYIEERLHNEDSLKKLIEESGKDIHKTCIGEKSLHPVMYPTILHFCLFHYIDHTKILITLRLHFREILISQDIDKRSCNFAAKI